MRYYCFTLNTGIEEIKEKTQIKLRDYAYQNPMEAINNYMNKTIKNSISFFNDEYMPSFYVDRIDVEGR